jgi:hypothetical protein
VRQARQAVERERGGGEGHQKIVAPNSRNTGSFRNVSGDPSMRSLSGGATQAKGDQVRRGFRPLDSVTSYCWHYLTPLLIPWWHRSTSVPLENTGQI